VNRTIKARPGSSVISGGQGKCERAAVCRVPHSQDVSGAMEASPGRRIYLGPAQPSVGLRLELHDAGEGESHVGRGAAKHAPPISSAASSRRP
jgi:hypothetical protein